MSTNTVTGTTVLRQALYARARKGHLGPIARDLSERGEPIGVASLEAFLSGAQLPVATLQLLAKELYGDAAEYDPERNLLRSANRAEPKLMGIAPAPFDPKTSSYPGRPPNRPRQSPR
jgi:hypothetical protein